MGCLVYLILMKINSENIMSICQTNTKALLFMFLSFSICGNAYAAGTDVTFNTRVLMPNMLNQQEGIPVCIDDVTGELVANCGAAKPSVYSTESDLSGSLVSSIAQSCVIGPHSAGSNEVALMELAMTFQTSTQETLAIIAQYSLDGVGWNNCNAVLTAGSNPAGGFESLSSSCKMPLTPGNDYYFAIGVIPFLDSGDFTVELSSCHHLVKVVFDSVTAAPVVSDESPKEPRDSPMKLPR